MPKREKTPPSADLIRFEMEARDKATAIIADMDRTLKNAKAALEREVE